jgi:hypothetical protein
MTGERKARRAGGAAAGPSTGGSQQPKMWDSKTAQAQAQAQAPPKAPKADSPFVYPELSAGLLVRAKQEQALRLYLQEVQPEALKLHNAMQRAAQAAQQAPQGMKVKTAAAVEVTAKAMEGLRERVDQRAQQILYGVDTPGARREYVDKYGCVRWTAPALAEIARHSPLVEMGAGRGQWKLELAKKGADVLAYDSGANEFIAAQAPASDVVVGDHSQLPQHTGRALFLCYPPPGDMATLCLQQYRGKTLLYVGEGRGGVNGQADFFDLLEGEWECAKVLPLEPFAECFERLFVLRRKGEWKPPQPVNWHPKHQAK